MILEFDRDARARRRIRTELGRSMVVEASAGTGKTSALISRLVEVLKQGHARVDSIVAVTFTRKAAGELKLRLRQELDRARAGSEQPEHVDNLEQAIEHLEQARIGTIHGFCADLLRERPVEAGIDPGFREVADDEGPRLFATAFDLYIQEQLDQMPPGLRRALSRLAVDHLPHLGSAVDRLRDEALRLVDWRDFDAPLERRELDRKGEIDELVGLVDRLAASARRGENSRDPLRVNLDPVLLLQTWIERAEEVAERDHDGLEARLLDLLRQLKRRDRQRTGYGKFAEGLPREQVVRERDLLIDRMERFKQRADADLAALLKSELGLALERYEQLKQRSGRLDFADLLIKARDLLLHRDDVRRHLQQRFTHIFVDEFQDTDPLQAEILLLLSADDPDETDWLSVRPVSGKLFVVGDPKQSIYRFRRADVSLYRQIRERLTQVGVELLQLRRSFRSTAPLQRLVNAAFESEMTGGGDGAPEYIPLEEHRPAIDGQPAIVALPAPRPYGYRHLSALAIEQCLPDTVAAYVAWLIEHSGYRVEDPDSGALVAVAPRHVCILFRRFLSWNRDITRDYTRALESRGVPHLLVGSRTFHQREEVETLRAALVAIEWPHDELALFATLRGSLFSFSDELLLRFRSEHGGLRPFRWHTASEDELQSAADNGFGAVVEVLRLLVDLHRRRNRRAIVQTVQELLAETRAQAGFALRPAGGRVLANVERICELARHFEVRAGSSFRAFVDELSRQAEKPTGDEAPVAEEGAEGVRIMTVHRAKGLEFPVVVLADLTASIARQEPERTLDPAARLCASRILGCAPYELLERRDAELALDREEGVRVAYVAATRARDLLVVTTVGDEKRRGWLEPLNKALYPTTERWRRSETAVGTPAFGESSVLERPIELEGRPEGSVKPGLHRKESPSGQEYGVVWWDPAVLQLSVAPNFGLRQEQILAPTDDSDIEARNRRRYQDWRDEQERVRERARRPTFSINAVTELEQGPREAASIAVEQVERDPERPTGRRFGTLVHSVLKDVALDADADAVLAVAALEARLVGAPGDEVAAAAEVVRRALAHPLLERARRSDRLHRELAFSLPVGSDLVVEGVIDLAFRDSDPSSSWVVVDFKTDLDPSDAMERYRAQLGWYVEALEQLTGQPASGALLSI